MHTCELCDFSSDLSSDLKRHLETKKHIKKEYLLSLKNKKIIGTKINDSNFSYIPSEMEVKNHTQLKEMTTICTDILHKNDNFNEPEKSKTETLNDENPSEIYISDIKKNKNGIFCDCGKSFNHRQSLYTHRKNCKDLKYMETISKLTNQVDMLTKRMNQIEQIPESTISASHNTNSHNSTNNINSHNTLNQKSINVVTYVNQNYNDVKPLMPLKGKDVMQILEFDESCGQSLEEMIVFQHRKYLLDQFLGEFIINKYVKKDPKTQQFWSSNIKKLTFLVRHVLNKTDKVWLKDSNGVCITKHIITPILAEIRKLIDIYIKACHAKMQLPHTPTSEFDKLHDSGFHGVKILYEIDQKILHHKILLYIAPYFQIDGIPKMLELE